MALKSSLKQSLSRRRAVVIKSSGNVANISLVYWKIDFARILYFSWVVAILLIVLIESFHLGKHSPNERTAVRGALPLGRKPNFLARALYFPTYRTEKQLNWTQRDPDSVLMKYTRAANEIDLANQRFLCIKQNWKRPTAGEENERLVKIAQNAEFPFFSIYTYKQKKIDIKTTKIKS